MKIQALRYNHGKDHSNGLFLIDKKYRCDTLEDEYREIKVKHKTRIPDGIYKVELRTVGGFHQRYLKRYGSWHKGMLWIKDVPGFEFILIHVGNDDDDTSGCLLLGYAARNDANFIANSRVAYKSVYPEIRNAILKDEEVTIEFKSFDI